MSHDKDIFLDFFFKNPSLFAIHIYIHGPLLFCVRVCVCMSCDLVVNFDVFCMDIQLFLVPFIDMSVLSLVFVIN